MTLNIDDEQGIELLYFIFERELKPPFKKGEKNKYGNYHYLNRDGIYIGYLRPQHSEFVPTNNPYLQNIKYKVCQVFEFSENTRHWWRTIKPHLKSWLGDQLNIELEYLY